MEFFGALQVGSHHRTEPNQVQLINVTCEAGNNMNGKKIRLKDCFPGVALKPLFPFVRKRKHNAQNKIDQVANSVSLCPQTQTTSIIYIYVRKNVFTGPGATFYSLFVYKTKTNSEYCRGTEAHQHNTYITMFKWMDWVLLIMDIGA